MQEVLIIIIGILVFGFTGWRIYKFFRKKPGIDNQCIGCNSDCALRNIKLSDCKEKNKDQK